MKNNHYSPSADFIKSNAAFQGIDASLSPDKQKETPYPGVDSLQNATINDNYIYISTFDTPNGSQHEKIVNGEHLDGKYSLTGYFSNEATASRHINDAGQFDAYGYHRDVCVCPHKDSKTGEITDKAHLDRFYIDRDRLEEIYGTRDFNAAIGKCHANNQYGPDGGDQGYNPYLNEFYNNGCIKYAGTYDAVPGSTTRCAGKDYKQMRTDASDKCSAIISGQSPEDIQKIGYALDERCNQPTGFNAEPISDLSEKYKGHEPKYNEDLAKATSNLDRRTDEINKAHPLKSGPNEGQLPESSKQPESPNNSSAGPSEAQLSASGTKAESDLANNSLLADSANSQNGLSQTSLEGAQKAAEDAAASTAQDALKGATDAAKAPAGGIT